MKKFTLYLSCGLIAMASANSLRAQDNVSCDESPVRIAQVKAKVTRYWYENGEDGSIQYKTEVVCEKTGPVNVYCSPSNTYRMPSESFSCSTNLANGEKGLFTVAAGINLQKDNDSSSGIKKIFEGYVLLTNPHGHQRSQHNLVSTTDVSLENISFVVDTLPTHAVEPMPNEDEFSVSLTISDRPQ